MILILLDIGAATAVSIPELRLLTGTILGTLFPTAPVAVIGFALTILSNRLAVLVQELALERAHHKRAMPQQEPVRPGPRGPRA